METTFDIAEYWKDYADYGEIRLDYDSYNPDNTLTAQIGVQMPTVGEDFNVNFTRMIKTFFNGQLQSDGEFVEILEYFDRNDRRVSRNLSSKITYDTSGQSSHGRILQNQPRNLEKQLEAEETIDNLADTRPVGSGHELTKVPENLDVVKTAFENEPTQRKTIIQKTETFTINGREVDPNSKEAQDILNDEGRAQRFAKLERQSQLNKLKPTGYSVYSGYTGGGSSGDDEEDL